MPSLDGKDINERLEQLEDVVYSDALQIPSTTSLELKSLFPSYDDVTDAPDDPNRIVHATGNGPQEAGLYRYKSSESSWVSVGEGGGFDYMQTSQPSNTEEGETWYDTDDDQAYVFDGNGNPIEYTVTTLAGLQSHDLDGNSLVDDTLTIWDATADHVPQAQLENDSITVGTGTLLTGGATLALGDSTTIERDTEQEAADNPYQIPIVALEDTESVEIAVPVGDTETLEIYRWGAYKVADGTAPTGLDVELLDGSDTVQASENTNDTRDPSTPIASYENTSGSASVFKVRAHNETGGALDAPGVSCHFGTVVV